MSNLPPVLAAWVARHVGARVTVERATRLGGPTGPWRLELGNATHALVVLRDGEPSSDAERARLGIEVTALEVAERLGVPAPRVLGFDLSGAEASRLAVLTSHVSGESRIPFRASSARLREIGRAAAALSRQPLGADDIARLPHRLTPLADLDFAGARMRGDTRDLMRMADEYLAHRRHPVGTSALVHGDCWNGNTLWRDERFCGFVDWDAAGHDPAGLDLGNLRFDAALLFGPDAPPRSPLVGLRWTVPR